ncbi:MAG: phosphotransferase family protein [Alphaproteobacteria bacterium]|nr:phosphotransferase family protein [Alphaproteobacteria bacterium]
MSAGAELIDPRPGEELDTTRLEPWLRANLPAGDGKLTVRQFAGGHANLTYLVRLGMHEYVLRRPPLGPIAPSSHDMKREHCVLAAMPKVFSLAPQSYAYCGDATVIGAEFHVMERRYGIVIRQELPPRFAGDPALARRIGEMMIATLAGLHMADAGKAGLGDFGRPEGFVQRQLDGWTKRWHAAKDRDLPRIGEVIAWLHRRIPQPCAATFVHNDFKLDNLLVESGNPDRAVAVLDWDMLTRGDPLMDVGYLLNFWSEAGDDPRWRIGAAMPTWHHGFPSRTEAVEHYARLTGFDCTDVTWYHVFGIFKLAVIIQQIYIRYLRGQTQDVRFADFGTRVAVLGEKGCTVLAGGSGA